MYVSTGRAIIIALLLIALPVYSASVDENPSLVSTENRAVSADSNQVRVSAAPGTKVKSQVITSEDSVLETDTNKNKLAIFFAIGLVINIVLMTLFGIWAVRQWRKSDNEG